MPKLSPWVNPQEGSSALDNLGSLLKHLQAEPRWREIASPEIEGSIGQAILDYEAILEKARRGERVKIEVVQNVAQEVEFLSTKIWDSIEGVGGWTNRLEEIYNDKIEPLRKEDVLERYIDALIAGPRR